MRCGCDCTTGEPVLRSPRKRRGRVRFSTADRRQQPKKFWPQLLSRWNTFQRPHARMELRVRGLPDHYRANAWYVLSGGQKLAESSPFFYSSLQEDSCIIASLIDRDIPRTYVDIPFDSEALGRILKAYANLDSEVGYCQGMNFICAFILLTLNDNEEKAFWTFTAIMSRIRTVYLPDLHGFIECARIVDDLILQQMIPELYSHFETIRMQPKILINSWIHTMFCYPPKISQEFVLTFWDHFVVDGMEVLIRVIIALLYVSKKLLLACSNDMEVIKMLRGVKIKDTKKFFELTWRLRIPRSICIEIQAVNSEYEYTKLKTYHYEEINLENIHDFQSIDGLVVDSPTGPVMIV